MGEDKLCFGDFVVFIVKIGCGKLSGLVVVVVILDDDLCSGL